MSNLTLKLLTLATAVTAVVSALWLASGDSGLPGADGMHSSAGVFTAPSPAMPAEQPSHG